MRRYITIALVLGSVLLSAVTLTAQGGGFDNDPNTNLDANACLEDGSMEGKCNQDIDGDGVVSQAEIDWSWTCGWYLIRWENDLIPTELFPQACISLIEDVPIPFCINYWGIWYSDIPNVQGNALYFDDFGCWGSEAYSFYEYFVIVNGDTVDVARANCTAIFGNPNFGFFVYPYPGPKEDLWICIGNVF